MAQPCFGMCCKQGKVHLESIEEYPALLKDLLDRRDPLGTHFRENTRRYNQCLAMASTGIY